MTGEPDVEVVPLKGVRRVIAQRMLQSLQSSAQLTYHAEADVTGLMAWRATLEPADRPGVEDCVIAALATALRVYPAFNAIVEPQAATIHRRIDVAVAIAVGGQLMTPVVRDVGGLDLDQITAARRDLVRRAGEGRLTVSEMKGGTFTLSNLGMTPVRFFTPILNGSQAAILGLGRIASGMAIDEGGEIRATRLLGLSLTADHRWVDGEPAGRFLAALIAALQAPPSPPKTSLP